MALYYSCMHPLRQCFGCKDLLRLNIGNEIATALIQQFSHSDDRFPTNFQPIINISDSLGKELFTAVIQSIERQKKNSQRKDDALRRELQQAMILNLKLPPVRKYKKGVATNFKLSEFRDKKELHFDFQLSQIQREIEELAQIQSDHKAPNLDLEVAPIQRDKQAPNLDLLKIRIDQEQQHLKLPEVVTDSSDEKDLITAEQSADYFREKAEKHFQKESAFYHKARYYQQRGHKRQADYYFDLAHKQTVLFQQANHLAAAAFLAENDSKNPFDHSIDLHHLYVKEALAALDQFLDQEISMLREENIEFRDLKIITGRGKHSANGIARIKPAAEERLKQRDLRFVEVNPGCLKSRLFIYTKSMVQ